MGSSRIKFYKGQMSSGMSKEPEDIYMDKEVRNSMQTMKACRKSRRKVRQNWHPTRELLTMAAKGLK